MSKVSTLTQAAGILTLLDEQKLDLDEIQVIRPYLVLLTKGAKNGQLPDIETFRALTEGRAKVEMVKFVVDFDKPPSIPDGWTILSDSEQLPLRMKGVMEYDPAKVVLYLDLGQKDGKMIEGSKLREKLKNVPVYGAQLLDFYLANPYFIPKEWKGKRVFFWGTIYRLSVGYLYVRCLGWDGGRWRWDFCWLGSGWDVFRPALVPVN